MYSKTHPKFVAYNHNWHLSFSGLCELSGLWWILFTWDLSCHSTQRAAESSEGSGRWPVAWLTYTPAVGAGCWLAAKLVLLKGCVDMMLELLKWWSLRSELELPKNNCPKRQDIGTASPIRGYACNSHCVTSAAFCWSKQTQNPPWWASSQDGVLQDNIAENLAGWEICRGQRWKMNYAIRDCSLILYILKRKQKCFSLSPILKGFAQAIIFYLSSPSFPFLIISITKKHVLSSPVLK